MHRPDSMNASSDPIKAGNHLQLNLKSKGRRRRLLQWAVLISEKAWLIGITGTLIALLTIALSVMTMMDSRYRAIQHVHETAANLTTIVRNDIARNFELYSLSLLAIVDGAEDPEVKAATISLQRKILFDRAITAEFLGGAYLLDTKGNILLESKMTKPSRINLGDREYFKVHTEDKDRGMYFSKPFASRITPGKVFLGMSRRTTHPDGSFSGVALMTVSIDYFSNILDKINVGNNSVVSIIDVNGTLIARKPFLMQDVGRDISKSTVFQHIAGKDEGFFEETSPQTRCITFLIFRVFAVRLGLSLLRRPKQMRCGNGKNKHY